MHCRFNFVIFSIIIFSNLTLCYAKELSAKKINSESFHSKKNTQKSSENEKLNEAMKKYNFEQINQKIQSLNFTYYSDYLCPACAKMREKICTLMSHFKQLHIKFENIAVYQKSIESALISELAKQENKNDLFDKEMMKIHISERNPQEIAARIGIKITDIYEEKNKNIEKLKLKIIENNGMIKKFGNNEAPLLVISKKNTNKFATHVFIQGNVEYETIFKAILSI